MVAVLAGAVALQSLSTSELQLGSTGWQLKEEKGNFVKDSELDVFTVLKLDPGVQIQKNASIRTST